MTSYDYESQLMSPTSSLTEIALSKLETKLSIQKGSSTLNLSDCFIGDEGCVLLSSYIQQHPNLQSLELRGNSISGEGLKHLSPAFRHQSLLRALSLEWNNVSDSVGVLLDSLALSPSIQSVDLRNNRITSEGASHIARFLETNSSIVRIDLRWNELGSIGGRKLLQAVSRCRSLKTLELNGNKIPEDVLIQIEESLAGPKDQSFEIRANESQRNESEVFSSSRKSPGRSHLTYSDDLYSKFEAQMIQNSRNSAKINELEILLQQESRKMQDLKNEFYKELEAEKARRSFAEESLALFKEESLNRDMENQRLIQELEGRVSSLSTDKSSVTLQFQTLQAEYEILSNEFQAKSRNYEEKLNIQEKQSRLNEENLKNLIERHRRDHEQNTYELSREFQLKNESLNRENSSLAHEKESLDSEIRSLRAQINYIKSQAEDALKDLEQKLRDEESQKLSTTSRNYEARIQNLEDSRENLAKRLQDMQKDFNSAEIKYQEQVHVLETNIVQAREEKSDLTLRLQKVSAQKDNLQNDFLVTKNALDRSQAENNELSKALKERKEAHNNQIERMCNEHCAERKILENSRDSVLDKNKELENELNRVRREKEKILRDFEYLNEVLKSKVSLLIQETVINHMRKVEGE